MAIDPIQVGEWLKDGTAAIGLLRAAQALLPNGPKRAEIAEKIEAAERALGLSNATAAKALGYELCKCTFPPQIMLWNEAKEALVCPSQTCGRTVEKAKFAAPPEVQRAPGKACPACGAYAFRVTKSQPIHGNMGKLGVKNVTSRCGDCGFEGAETVVPQA